MNINEIIKKVLSEATSDSTGSRGSYVPPLQPGMREFEKDKLAPFTQSLNNFKSPLVAYDSYDHKFDLRKNQIKKLEKTAKKITDYIKHHPYSTFSDTDGNVINLTPSGKQKNKKEIVPITRKGKKINESSTTLTAGEYSGPQELGLKKWKNSELGPFTDESDIDINDKMKKKTTKKNIKRIVGMWEKDKKGSYDVPTHDVDSYEEKKITEDLAVWFGTKKKPKGSRQPKGPWVDICRKVNGKHPPCGRKDTDSGAYPKCRAAGVAGKMSDSAKKSACQQKRRAEKKDTQTGKGQKPIMTSYKPRKKNTNENMKTIRITERELVKTIKKIINEQTRKAPELNCDWFIMDTPYLGGVIGELHYSEIQKGKWAFEKYTTADVDEPSTLIELDIPFIKDIEVAWDEQKKAVKLVGSKSLDGLYAYNTIFNQNDDEYSCNVIFHAEGQPSRYGVVKPILSVGKVSITPSSVLKVDKISTPVEMKDGAVANVYNNYYINKKLIKKDEIYNLTLVTKESELEDAIPCE